MAPPHLGRRRRIAAAAAALAVSSACTDEHRPDPTAPAAAPLATAAAAPPAPAPGTAFLFLPSLGPAVTTYHGAFDGTRAPVVEVCRWTGTACDGAPVARYTLAGGTSDGAPADPLRVVTDQQHYRADWKSRPRPAGAVYRVRVLLGTAELGAARVRVLKPGETEAQVLAAGYAPASQSQTFLVRFRLETSADYLPGEAGAAAGAAVPDLAYVPRVEDFSPGHPRLGDAVLSHNTVLLVPAPAATVGGVNALLAEYGAATVGGVRGAAGSAAPTGVLVLRLPTATHAALDSVLRRLDADPRVATVVQDAAQYGQALPGGAAEPSWTWGRTPAGGNWGLEAMRVPQLWNLNAGVEKALAKGAARTGIGVFDRGFREDHPDVAFADVVNRKVFPDTTSHGTGVASIIGAGFGNGAGLDGVNPFRVMYGRAVDGSSSNNVYEWAGTVGDFLVNTFPAFAREHKEVPVVNVSLGYNWYAAKITVGADTAAQRVASRHGRAMVAEFRSLAGRGVALPLVVAGAGNESGNGRGVQAARWGSVLANAALEHGAKNVVVVGALARVPDATGGVEPAGFSSASDEQLWAPGANVLAATRTGYAPASGTSYAAPHVAGLVSYLYTLAPELPRPTLTDNRVYDLLVGTGGYAGRVVGRRRVDAFAAAMGVDRVIGGDRVLRILVDVDDGTVDGDQRVSAAGAEDAREDADGDGGAGDGVVDMADFRRWRDWLLAAEGKGAGLDGGDRHPKKDVNGNGRFAADGDDEHLHPRGDFNGDGRLSRTDTATVGGAVGTTPVTDLQVLGNPKVWADPDVPADSLPHLVNSADLHVNAAACFAVPGAARVESRVYPTASGVVPLVGKAHDASRPERVYTVRTADGGHAVQVDVRNAAGEVIASAERDYNALPAGTDAHWAPVCEATSAPPPPAAAPAVTGVGVQDGATRVSARIWVPGKGLLYAPAAAPPAPGERYEYSRTVSIEDAEEFREYGGGWGLVTSRASASATGSVRVTADAQGRISAVDIHATGSASGSITIDGQTYGGMAVAGAVELGVGYEFEVGGAVTFTAGGECGTGGVQVERAPGTTWAPPARACGGASGTLAPGRYVLRAKPGDSGYESFSTHGIHVPCTQLGDMAGCWTGTASDSKQWSASAHITFAPAPAPLAARAAARAATVGAARTARAGRTPRAFR
jgi:subtilisin family serine protease